MLVGVDSSGLLEAAFVKGCRVSSCSLSAYLKGEGLQHC